MYKQLAACVCLCPHRGKLGPQGGVECVALLQFLLQTGDLLLFELHREFSGKITVG
jgi:hypothetical protein